MSADSGIPTYRDADGRWSRSQPVVLQDFLRSPQARRRYWARSMVGWPRMAAARPNAAHAALARLQAGGRVSAIVTQNVDGLQQRAGSDDVIELHGSLGRVVCLECAACYDRAHIQSRLEIENDATLDRQAPSAPDGDADLPDDALAAFTVPACERCGGMLKPTVVFFGEGVPRDRVDAARERLSRADAMLVVGSSLMVWSGYRFCEWAHAAGQPIAAVNLGRTRADAILALKVERPCAEALDDLCAADAGALGATRGTT